MASNFELIGFSWDDIGQLDSIAQKPGFSGDEVDFGGTRCLVVRDPAGAELWVSSHGRVTAANPFFATGTPCQATIDAVIQPNPDYQHLEATLDLSLYQDGEVITRMRALSANVPEVVTTKKGFLGIGAKQSPITDFAQSPVALGVCVFSQTTMAFDTEEAFSAEFTDPPLAPQSFLPHGMFNADAVPADTTGFGAGKVIEAGLAENTFSGIPYAWARVDTCGGLFSVVWSPEACAPASPGQILAYQGAMIVRANAPFWAAS